MKTSIKFILLCLIAQLSNVAFAQQPEAGKVQKQENFKYSRPSLTLLQVLGNGGEYGNEFVNNFSSNEKFDFNTINTTAINAGDNELKTLMAQNIGKQVLFHWLHFDGKGFNSDVLEARSMYNATDQDVILDASKRVADLKYQGRSLMDNSYVMTVTPSKMVPQYDKKNKLTGYSTSVVSTVYKVNFNEDLLTAVWDNWMDSTLTQEEQNKRMEFFNNLEVGLDSITTVQVQGSGTTQSEAIAAASEEMLTSLEKKIDKWQVVSTIYSKNPIAAKIGKKEGLKNSQRYRAFKLIEDENGELIQKGLGYLRATNVADNRSVATGETEEFSNFYQISGGKLREGMYIKQKNDARIGVSASYNFGRHLTKKTGFSMAEITIDYLLHTSQAMGMMQYAMINIGYDDAKCKIEGVSGEYKGQMLQVSLGYGVGFHPIRPIEIMPYAFVGCDYNLKNGTDTEKESDESFMKKLGYYGGGGAKISFMVAYPVQLFVKADYSYLFSAGVQYVNPRDNSNETNKGQGLSVSAGFRVAF